MHMAARFLMQGLLALAVSVPLAVAVAQEPGKAKRVGLVFYSTSAPRTHLERAFLDGMRDQGYVEGKNLVIERLYAEGDSGRLREGAAALAALKLDAIVTTCSPSTRATKEATAASGTPVLMASVSDPVGQGLVKSLAHPGGNVSGRASQHEETLPKMLELLTGMAPGAGPVAVLYHAGNPAHERMWQTLAGLEQSRNLKLLRIDVAGRDDLSGAFDRIGRERFRAVLVLSDDPMTFSSREQVSAHAARIRVPAIYGMSEFVEQGGLMSYGENYAGSYRATAAHVSKVLAGARTADLPVEQPTRFELVINLKTARDLGLKVPGDILLQATRVIE